MLTTEERLIIDCFTLEAEQGRNKIFRMVRPEYFSEQFNQDTYDVLLKAYEADKKAPGNEFFLKIHDEFKDYWLDKAEETTPRLEALHLDDYIRIFLKSYSERKVKSLIDSLAIGGVTEEELQKLVEQVKHMSTVEVDNAQKYLDEYNKPVKHIKTGFSQLDEKLGGGFVAGTVTTIGARPSTGKTTFAINISTAVPERKVVFVSLEMTAGMIYDRIVADIADINYAKCVAHEVETSKIQTVIDGLKNLKVVDDLTTVEDIRDLIYAETPDLIVIDYMQIVNTKVVFDNSRQRIDYISRTLKATAKETGTQIIALSQITRTGKEKPTMSDLKESGGLEQDSDYIILLHRDYVNDKSNVAVDSKETIVTLDKNKFGSCGEFDMDFDGAKQRFTEIDFNTGRSFTSAEIQDLPFD